MSVSVYVKTGKSVVPEDIFKSLSARVSNLVFLSKEFPHLEFGVFKKSLRGVEINFEEDEYEIRICTCASKADYLLFRVTVEIMEDLCQTKAYEFEEDGPIGNIKDVFGDKWIEEQLDSSMRVTCILANHSSSAITYYGLFLPYCIGPNLLVDSEIDLFNPSKDSFLKMLDYLVDVQWSLAEKESTRSRLHIQNPNDSSDSKQLSIIHIKDNEIAEFDYIEYCPLFSIFDHDDNENVIVPFESLPKIARGRHLASIDEYQYFRLPEFTVDDAREMMGLAQKFQPDNLFQKNDYPGNGYNKEQQTFILMWNPSFSSITLENHIDSIQYIHNSGFNWSVYEWEKAKMGDRFYMVRVGDGNTGIVMSGIFTSQPYADEDWNTKRNSRKIHYMDMKPNFIVNPEVQAIITTEQLQEAIPDFEWRKGHSGQLLAPEQAQKLENIFADYIMKMSEVKDKENIAITNLKHHIE